MPQLSDIASRGRPDDLARRLKGVEQKFDRIFARFQRAGLISAGAVVLPASPVAIAAQSGPTANFVIPAAAPATPETLSLAVPNGYAQALVTVTAVLTISTAGGGAGTEIVSLHPQIAGATMPGAGPSTLVSTATADTKSIAATFSTVVAAPSSTIIVAALVQSVSADLPATAGTSIVLSASALFTT